MLTEEKILEKQTTNRQQRVMESPLLNWPQFKKKYRRFVSAPGQLGSDLQSTFNKGLSLAGLFSGAFALTKFAFNYTVEKKIFPLAEAREVRAAELSRQYNISEEALIEFLESLPQTIEECLQFSTEYIAAHNIRLVPGEPEPARFANAIETGKEIVVFNKDNFTIFHTARESLLGDDKIVSFDCSEQLKNVLSNFTFNGELLDRNESSRGLYETVYQEVRLNGGLPCEYGKSMAEIHANYLKIMIMLGLNPKELIEKKYLCRDVGSKYCNEEALTYIKALETEERRGITMSACQPALSLLEASSTAPLLFSGGRKLQTNEAEGFSKIVCDYLDGPSTVEAQHASLKRRA